MTAPPQPPPTAAPPSRVIPPAPPPDATWQAAGPDAATSAAAAAVGAATAVAADGDWVGGSPRYPVSVLFEKPARNGRLYAVPVIGGLVRILLLVPSLLALLLVGIPVMLVSMVPLSLIVLVRGRYPRWGYRLIGGWIRWTVRTQAFLFGLTDQYPPFRFGN